MGPQQPARRESSWWGSHFVFRDGRVRIPASGGDIKLDLLLMGDARRWLGYYALVRLHSLAHLFRRDRPTICFAPTRPRPWYIVWAACRWAGVRIVDDPAKADALCYFEDSTQGAAPDISHARRLNFRCTDVSKSHVAAVFERVFGYPLALDPERHEGVAVEKSEANGKHDGALITCPAPRRDGRSYQRYIDTAKDGVARDLRTPCVGGAPVIVMIKEKRAGDTFTIQSLSVRATPVETVFSAEECAQIAAFNAAMGLDWGSLDILRETATGRLFVVDVNKTDVGPPVVLSWRDRVSVTDALGRALAKLVRR
jgi:hypothetical protein